ncbi:hypothetical protein [Arthrobacter sp. H41]|uniref:hypothetical protein n=1 Tax=Arthrobacter sp. H41 TaxID=1312978 RepID=UPI0012DCBFAC|nr:hypothetical protein [Arthrobacter sp. H41]
MCKQCRATDAVNTLFRPAMLKHQSALNNLHYHLLAADPRYVLGLIRSKAAWTLLTAVLALPDTITHEDLDQLGTPRAVSQVRSLLVEHAVLPERDEYAHRLHAWTAAQIASLPHLSDQLAVRQFIRWRQQRRTRPGPLTNTTAANDKRELRLIFGFINHLNASNHTLSTTGQELIDHWARQAPRDAFRVRRFLRWSARSGNSRPLVPPDYGRIGFNLGGSIGRTNEDALKRALSEDTMSPRTRLAIVLNVVYGIRVHKIAELRLEDLSVKEGVAGIHLGTVRLDLPAATIPWITMLLAGVPTKRRFGGSTHNSTWVYPSTHHGDHQLPSSLAAHLRIYGVSPATAHQAATAAIITQVPPAVVARILGVSLKTTAGWRKLTGDAATYR